MNEFKKEVKAWLKRIGKNRFWLADNTYTTKATVDGWLSTRGYIPFAKIDKIKGLMKATERTPSSLEPYRERWRAVGVLMAVEDYELLEQAARIDGLDVEEWCARRLIDDIRKALPLAQSLPIDDHDICMVAEEGPAYGQEDKGPDQQG